MYTNVPGVKLLTNGKIIVTPNHVYAGQNKLDLTKDTIYTHPSSQQCRNVDASYLNGKSYTTIKNEIISSTSSATTIASGTCTCSANGRMHERLCQVSVLDKYTFFLFRVDTVGNITSSSSTNMGDIQVFLTDDTNLDDPRWVFNGYYSRIPMITIYDYSNTGNKTNVNSYEAVMVRRKYYDNYDGEYNNQVSFLYAVTNKDLPNGFGSYHDSGSTRASSLYLSTGYNQSRVDFSFTMTYSLKGFKMF